MFRRILSIAFLSTTAFAADLPMERPAAAPQLYQPQSIADWGGVYAGVALGIASNEDLRNESAWSTLGSLNPKDIRLSPLAAAHIGYGYQAGLFVYGAVADVTLNSVQRSGTATNGSYYKAEIKDNAALRLKAGYLFSKDVMIYAAAGFAAGNIKVTQGTNFTTTFRPGFVVSGGFEYRLAKHLSAGLEYRYTELKAHNFTNINNDRITTGFSDIRAIVSYRF